MDNNWYDNFLAALAKKYPTKPLLSEALMQLLFIEKEASYRRMRKDVLFPINEIVKIAIAWNISLDEIIGVDSNQVSFQMRKINYLQPSNEELHFLRSIIESINNLKKHPNTEFMDICNKLPRQILAGYEYLNQFSLFKWLYQYGNDQEVVPYSKINISEEKRQVDQEYSQAIKQVPNSNFIWDSKIFEYLTSNIRYFHSILMITDEEKELIKEELKSLLDYLNKIATCGCYPETQNKVNLYISQLNIDTNYSYTISPEANICFVHVFEKHEIYSFNQELITNFRKWMQQKKRFSVQISEVDERSRIAFFSKQQQLIESL